jgi:hypothetical protein
MEIPRWNPQSAFHSPSKHLITKVEVYKIAVEMFLGSATSLQASNPKMRMNMK